MLLIVIIIILILVKKKHTKSNQKINQGVTRFNENTNNSKPLNNVDINVDINVISNNYLAKKYDNKTLSKICFENNIHLPNQVKEFLDKIGIETYLIKIRNLLNEYAQELGTAKTLELLKNQNWYNSLNIVENSKSYEDDLGFFITQSLIIKEFNKEELLEIIEDSILKEIKNTNQN